MDVDKKENVVFDTQLKKFDHCHQIQIDYDGLDEVSNIEQLLLGEVSNAVSY